MCMDTQINHPLHVQHPPDDFICYDIVDAMAITPGRIYLLRRHPNWTMVFNWYGVQGLVEGGYEDYTTPLRTGIVVTT